MQSKLAMDEQKYKKLAKAWDQQYGDILLHENIVTNFFIEETLNLIADECDILRKDAVKEPSIGEDLHNYAIIERKLRALLYSAPIPPRPKHPKNISAEVNHYIVTSTDLTSDEIAEVISICLGRVEVDEDGHLSPETGVYESMIDEWRHLIEKC